MTVKSRTLAAEVDGKVLEMEEQQQNVASSQSVQNVVSPEPVKGLSESERLVNTFIAPSKTFADIRNNSRWWAPWVVLAVIGLLMVFAMDKKIGWDQIVQNEIAKNPKAVAQFDKMPATQREHMMELQVTIAHVMAYASPIILLISGAITAALLLGIFNFGFGTQISFSKMMAIVFYGWLPSAISSVLTVLTMFAGADPEGFNVKNPVATNPAYFLNPITSNKVLYGFASAIDLIAIWMIFLMATGISENSKQKRGTSFAVIAIAYLIFKVGGAALGAAFS